MNIHENARMTPAGRAHRADRGLPSPAPDGRADRDPALHGASVALEPKPPVQRYEYDAPGGMIHIHMKKLGRIERNGRPITGDRTSQRKTRGIGWEVMPDEKKETACAFTRRACANGLAQRRIDHPPTGPAPSCSGPFGAWQTRCRDQHQGRRDCDGDRAHGHAEPE